MTVYCVFKSYCGDPIELSDIYLNEKDALLEVESIESESSDNSYRAFVRTMQVKDRW
jgi:hypothetical protein